ncbi:hypothetical protein BGZ83_008408 [Gryganskiella cystojenkinii]|nr:hypothetical protein BGZ83_008408 [Gryganskiella cystojenkinii]
MSGLLTFTKMAFAAPRIALGNTLAMRGYASKKLFVGNIAWGTTDEEFNEFFGRFGPITDSYFPKDPQGRTKGFGFVELEEVDADKAIQEANGQEFNGRNLRVDTATPKVDTGDRERRPRRDFSSDRRDGGRDGGRRFNNREDGGEYRPRRQEGGFQREFRPRGDNNGGERQFRPRGDGDRQFRPRGDNNE